MSPDQADVPEDLTPPWIANARLLPLARASAETLQSLAPKSLIERGPLAPALERVTGEDPDAAQRSRRNQTLSEPGYDKRSRDDIDALVEKTR